MRLRDPLPAKSASFATRGRSHPWLGPVILVGLLVVLLVLITLLVT